MADGVSREVSLTGGVAHETNTGNEDDCLGSLLSRVVFFTTQMGRFGGQINMDFSHGIWSGKRSCWIRVLERPVGYVESGLEKKVQR